MLCKQCKSKPQVKGFQSRLCNACGNTNAIFNGASTHIHCNSCSKKFNECSICGKSLYLNQVNDKTEMEVD